MKARYLTIISCSLITLFCIQCKNASTSVELKQKELDKNKISVEAVFNDSQIIDESQSSKLSKVCLNLKEEYSELIHNMIANTDDDKLLQELIAWTKKPNHLYCLETYQAYNAFVEELNNTL